MPNNKPQIIQVISEMNILRLKKLLDIDRTYQDATKETFIERLNEIFEQFKESKDTKLIPFAGICESVICTNKNCEGLAFIGNVSNTSINLIFKESENNFEDIFTCSEFRINDKNCKPNDSFWIRIKNDEKVNFNPSAERLIVFEKCKIEYNEMIQSQKLTKELLFEWIDKNKELFNFIEGKIEYSTFLYKATDNFTSLYSKLNDLTIYLCSNAITYKALAKYQKLNNADELEILKWLVENEEQFFKLFYATDNFNVVKDFAIIEINNIKLKLNINEYKHINEYIILCNTLYWDMLDKYRFLTWEEIEKLDPNSEESINRISLKYQLSNKPLN